MQAAEWRKEIGEMVRAHMRSPALEHYFSVKMNNARARLMITQLGLYIRHRRDCWAHVSANCPVMAVKRAILQHEYGEVIKDQYSDYGHLHLIVRQAERLGMTAEQVLDTKPIPTTRATLYAWAWLTHSKSWIEGLAALTVTEWTNDDRLLRDLGGGHSTRMARRWTEDMGIPWRDMPNFVAHSQADEVHSDMFLPFLERYARGELEQLALDAVQESLDLFALYREGVARAMEQIPLNGN
ncbi:MAG TPA: iron-containing redox enzyme family protein [candidate division Zixibacteria bacterium]|nr:iron-containing redox enzyme family protein [candidate division Zixibacteria bacterium]